MEIELIVWEEDFVGGKSFDDNAETITPSLEPIHRVASDLHLII